MSTNFSYKFLLPLIFIPLILVSIWFRNGLIMGGGEEGLPFYNPSKTIELLGIWMEHATGIPNLGILSRTTLFYPLSFLHDNLHIPNFILQAGTFFILLVVGIISCYFLTLNLLNRHQFSSSVALISSVFYLLNPFTISQIWGRTLIPQYFAFALLPLSILIFLLALQKRQYIFAIFLTLTSLIFSTAFNFVTFIMVYWLVLALTFIFWVLNSQQKKKDFLFGFSFFILFSFLWITANSWWLQAYIPVNNMATDRLGDFEGNLNSLIGVSRNFTLDLVARLLQRSYFSEVGYYGKIYVSIPFQLISLLLPFFVILGLIKAIKIDKLKQFRFFILLFVLGLFVSLGANPPFGWLFVWIFKNVSFLQPFRNPYEKFGLVYALGYAPLFALGIVYFFKTRFKVWGLVSILILICGVFVWPIWTGRIFAGRLDKKVGIPIPPYYQDLSEFLNKQVCCLHNKNSKDFRIFMTPVWGGDQSSYLWKDTIYFGFDPSLHLLNQPAISNIIHVPYYYDFISNIRRYMERINLAPSLALLRTKYLVDREDATVIPDNEKLHYKFLTTVIQPPNDASLVKRSVCQNMNVVSQDTSTTRLICQIPENEQDWQGVRYLHLEIKTDIASSLEVAIRDKKDVRNLWEGKVVSEYQTDNENWTSITIPINVPTAYSYSNPIDLAHISFLDILAYPKDSQNTGPINIDLKEIKLDPGRAVETNEFRLIKTFGKLKLHEPNNFKSPPEFGSFLQINKVLDFVQLFQEVEQKRDSIDQLGFLLTSQNPNKDLSILSKAVDSKIINKSKLSETRYWIETDQKSDDILLLLSKTFDPQWKVIPMVSKDELNGSFANDIKILKKSVLPESNHFVVNGYANLWKISGSRKYAIVFIPQIMADIGSKVSIFSVLIMIGVISIWGVIKLSHFYPRK
ncbi:MAG: Uncharacterized protein G01um10147_465 [Microgenomates group bacterium Gr01-1014_7]|nr:MAG: Uncharacterized protein G01um10147_465 [Microgenomates group bacterium Gr01-1014_7]